ncbi:MAG: SIMPL domain-containing protein [Anaerolineae bacterium]|nr:SIMPL domain-containing protein [Anaerolineae bacterium]
MNKQKIFILVSLALALGLAACSSLPFHTTTAVEAASLETSSAKARTEVLTQSNPSPTRQIIVSGTGSVLIVPDLAYVNIGVHSQSKNVADALATNTNQSKDVAEALKKMGVSAADIQTSNFNIYPQQQYDQGGEITGVIYMVDNSVYVTVRDLSKLGAILDAAVRAGANSINGVQFDVQNKEKAYSEARQKAVENARKQAEELAKAAGVQLGILESIQVVGTASPTPRYDTWGMGGGGMAATQSSVPVSAGQMMVSVDVNLTYQIQ